MFEASPDKGDQVSPLMIGVRRVHTLPSPYFRRSVGGVRTLKDMRCYAVLGDNITNRPPVSISMQYWPQALWGVLLASTTRI